ncbi:efflux RND transporter periplasmic adaptor subunit [Alteromonas pelagimontana]|uniref:Efflux RND transporter periplasmic adaptor subunit n=1 Tax=Alteromonas pelagimontana TaxID=1858656 RepID=A0A6M4MDX8_9ALTE|nr:efflux RND transporter periplasmic adaptor subunit [Alteromonas pelagimontana]QJR81312.1 efflux RND transporter periplasmic adaptor subunit [Alteromonas pelagimontana]
MRSLTKLTLGIVAGIVVGAGAAWLLLSSNQGSRDDAVAPREPLYWVAPMDPEYRRDAPGKSPMGMDLVPVYEDTTSEEDYGAGVVTIAPAMVNNLGVRTAKVQRNVLKSAIQTVGYVQYNEDELVHIHPRVEGWIDKLYIKATGEPVTRGEPLYTLYSPALVNAQEEYLIAKRRGNASLISAAKERLKALQLAPQVISALEKTSIVQQNITFYAPQSGVVNKLSTREGFYVKPGDTLMSIGQLDEVWLEAEVFARDAGAIQQGLPVTVNLDYQPGKQWRSDIDYIYPSVNQQNRTLRFRVRLENPDRVLKPNMFASITVHLQEEDEALVVPQEAVIRTGSQNRVVVALEEGRFKSIEVTLGRESEDEVEILSGVSEGDTVVTSAQFLLDSESSKTSDFIRMQSDSKSQSIWTRGVVETVMPAHRMVTVSHDAIPEWEWPEMTMDFNVADAVDITQLAEGLSLHLEITRRADEEYAITAIHVMGHDMSEDELTEGATEQEPDVDTATVNGTIENIDRQNRILVISRDAIEKWNRPPATVEFALAANIEIDQLHENMAVTFTFEVRDDFVIVAIAPQQDHQGMDHAGHEGRKP